MFAQFVNVNETCKSVTQNDQTFICNKVVTELNSRAAEILRLMKITSLKPNEQLE